MKLENILDDLSSFDKLSFLKIIDGFVPSDNAKRREKEKILSQSDGQVKNVDNKNVAKILHLVEDGYASHVRSALARAQSQVDILIDILIRDGNCLMRIDWLEKLYKDELKHLTGHVKELKKEMDSPAESGRLRDYRIYRECLKVAYHNDAARNETMKVTEDEQSILNVLAGRLDLSQEEIKLINYQIIALKPRSIDECMTELKEQGLAFYSKKSRMVYVPDEVVRILRKVRGKEVADKHYRRVLKHLKEPQINQICKSHNIKWKAPTDEKIKCIINEGISFSNALLHSIHKPGASTTAKKVVITQLMDKNLKISPTLKGARAQDKINNLIHYFNELDKDEKVSISVDGYDNLCRDLQAMMPKLKKTVKTEFQLQEEDVLQSSYLLDYNIKPRDLLYSLSEKELEAFGKKRKISGRGDMVTNILNEYEDSENIYLENFQLIGYRDIAALKEEGIKLKDAELGVKFEEITKKILENLGLNVDEKLRKTINDKKNKIDVLINLETEGLIIVECKSKKESGYNKFSSVSRQVKAYVEKAQSKGYFVRRALLVAPEFSDDFVNACSMSDDLEMSLVEASTLKAINDAFKKMKQDTFPYRLLTKDVVIDGSRVLKAIRK